MEPPDRSADSTKPTKRPVGEAEGELAPDGLAAAGYAHPAYARSLSELGEPLFLERCGGWALERPIAESDLSDAMGPYPLFACTDWSGLPADLAELGARFEPPVSLTVVTDPLAEADANLLRLAFPDLARPFKGHYLVDLARPPEESISGNHRRNLKRARRSLLAERLERPLDALDAWCDMYALLMRRHRIRGIAAFSRASFAGQLGTPGIRAYRALEGGEAVGLSLWYRHGEHAWYHLSAMSERGRRLRASYLLVAAALEDLRREGVERVDLGAGAGLVDEPEDGLGYFKHGWSTGRAEAWLCGRVFDREAYGELARARGRQGSDYFPAYRPGEFD